MTTDFAHLPPHARLWLYVTAEPLVPDAADALRRDLATFTQSWTSHGRAVHAASDVREGRLIVLAGHVPGADAVSGCGIDASVHAVEDAAQRLGLALASSLDVVYRRADGRLDVLPRLAFKRMARSGEVGADTPVLDLTVDTVADWTEGRAERRAGDSWHARMLPASAPA
jgi:hypothetical protein